MMKTLEAMMRSMRAGGVALLCALIGLGAATGSAATVTATAEPFRLSIRHDGIRPSAGDETLTYSGLWDGGDDATVTLAQEGVPLAEGLAGEGERTWNVARNGTYTLTHTTYTNGVEGKVETATLVVTGRDVPFGAADVSVGGYTGVYDGQPHGIDVTVAKGIAGVVKRYATNPSTAFTEKPPTLTDVGSMTVWCEISAPGYITQTNSATVTVTPRPVTLMSKSATKVYDGTPLTAHEVTVGGDGFADGEGATYAFTGAQTVVGTSENTFTHTLSENTKTGNYEIDVVNGTLTVTKASIGGGESGDDEPGDNDIPDGGLSKFDASFVYDGEGHTVDTNALQAAFGAALIGESAVEYATGGSQFTATVSDAMNCVPPCFTNAGEYVVWYRVSNPNYEDFVHAAKVTIAKRPVILTSGTKLDFVYDGQPHACPHFIKSGHDFVEGEGIEASNWATVTTVAEGEVANTFDYAPLDGTDFGNYELTVVTGRIAVVAASIPVGPGGAITVVGYTNVYDGAVHGVTVSAAGLPTTPTVQYRASEVDDWSDVSPTFSAVCNTQVWYRVSAPNYTPVVGAVGVRIMPRPITLTAPTKSKTYDRTPLTFGSGDVVVGGDGYAPGEAFALSGFASITDAGRIDTGYTVADGTARMDNYAIMRVAGTLTVTRRAVSLTSKSATKVYDGMPLTAHEVMVGSDGFVGSEGATYSFTGSQTAVGTSENIFTYVLNENTAAGNYEISTAFGTLTVTKAVIGGGGDEPGDGEIPDGGLSKFDTTFVYDGEGHTVDTNGIVAAFGAVMGGENVVEYAAGGSQFTATVSDAMNCVPPCFTNAGEYVVWYRVTNPNYEDFVHAAKVTITPRPVTLTSGTKLDFVYDGTAHTHPHVEVSGLGFVAGEGVTTSNWATVTTVAQGEVVNTFDYAAQEGTDLENYELMIVTGRIAVVAAPIPVGPGGAVTAIGYTNVYDGATYGVAVSVAGLLTTPTVQYRANEADAWADASSVYSNVCDTQVWYRISAPNYAPVVGTVGVRIVPRAATVTSRNLTKPYDGTPLMLTAADITASGIVDGESLEYSDFASRTEVGQTPATFSYAAGANTRLANYEISSVYGTLTVTRSVTEITVTAKSGSWVYDGQPHVLHEYDATNIDTLQPGDELAVTFDTSSVVATPVDGVAGDGRVENRIVGVRVMRGDLDVSANYTLVSYPGTLTVTPRPVTLTSKSATKVYDGAPLTAHEVTIGGDGFVDDEGATYAFTGSQTTVGTSENTFTYTLNENTSAGNYEITTVNGTLTVTKASIGGEDGGDEPGDGEIPAGGLSKFDATYEYDGEGHTIDTNALVAAFGAAMGGGETRVDYGYAAAGAAATGQEQVVDRRNVTPIGAAATGQEQVADWRDVAPTYTNAGEYVVWYRVTNPNYEDFVHAAKVTITKRPVTLTSGTKTDFVYDGTAHSYPRIEVGGLGFVAGEGVTTSNWATVTEVTESEVANSFDYAPLDGTDLVNYAVTVVTGRIAVMAAPIPVGPDGVVSAVGYTNVYDGVAHGVAVSVAGLLTTPTVQYRADEANDWTDILPVFRDVCDTQVWYRVSAPNYAPVVGTVGIRITPRPVTLTALTKSKTYDGTPLTFDTGDVVVGGNGYAPGEAFALSGFASITEVGKVDAGYTVADGTARMDNYEITRVAGTLAVTRRAVSLISKSATKVYDGTPLTAHEVTVGGDGFVDGEGAVYTFSGSQTTVGTSENTFIYTLNGNTKAGNYEIATENGTLTVTKASIGGESDEPGDGDVPDGGLSKFDATFVYDGEGHTIDTNALVAAFGTALIGESAVEYAAGGSQFTATVSDAMNCVPPCFTNAGEYVVWYRVTNPNYEDFVHAAKVTISKRPVTLASKSDTKVYDGTPLTAHAVTVGGDGFADGEGATYAFTGEQTAVGTSENTFTYTLNGNTVAGNYAITTVNGTLTVTKASIGGGEEPGGGEVPDGGLSKFDTTFVYDGEGHTVDTNALVEAFAAAMGVGETRVYYGYAAAGAAATGQEEVADWREIAPTYTNAGEYVVWYRVTNPNYEDFVHAAKVTITKRPVTLTSGTKTDFVYDGAAHTYPHTGVSGLGFVAGEGVTTSNWATVTTVAQGEVANTFDYAAQEGTDLMNYAVTVVTGRIAVMAVPIPVGPGGAVTVVGYTNAYDGAAHGVAVSVAGLLTAPTVQYRVGEAEDWTDASPVFDDICDTQVWYIVTVPNYTPVVGTVGVRITPRPVTLTSKSDTKVYDGTPLTAHEVTVGGDGFVDGEGATYAFTGSQTAVGTSENTFTYALNENTSAGNYAISTVNGTLTVTKASIGGGEGGGDEPGDGDVPDGGLSKFDTTFVYDGEGHTIDTNALVEAFAAVMGRGETRVYYGYAAAGAAATGQGQVADWREIAPTYTNAGEYVVRYRVTNPNYEDFVHAAKVTITPRDISKATIAPIPDVTFTGEPATPIPVVTDQTPSIIGMSDYTVSYRDNDRPGTATVTLAGTGNYRGTKSTTFVIKPTPVLYAALRGTLAWKLNTGTGCYTAQLKLTCTNGFEQGISDLKFVYQDRTDGAKITSGLWDSSARTYRPAVSIDGTAYRFVELDAEQITGQDVTALYGVRDIAQAIGMVPSAECAIELFVGNLSSPISDIGYVVWKSNGTSCALPVSAAGGSQGLAVSEAMLKAVRMAVSAPFPGVPLSLSALNTSLALGVVVDPASSPYCRLTDFTVAATDLVGRIEVGKANGGTESKGALGTNARVVLLGAKNLADGFAELGRVSVDAGGTFRFVLGDKGCHFFRVRIEIGNVIE